MKACCVTGHRDIPADKIRFVERELRKELQLALDDGYRHFISGFVDGADLLFARLVIEYREKCGDIFLEAALPYPYWKKGNRECNALLSRCNGTRTCNREYRPDCFQIRNQYMVDACERVIAVYDGREAGGTVNTIRYARKLNREIRTIRIEKGSLNIGGLLLWRSL